MATKSDETGVSFSDVAVCLGVIGKDGKRQEMVHQIDGADVRIVSVAHGITEKVKQAKDEEGNSLGFEPTGEYELTLKVKFIRG